MIVVIPSEINDTVYDSSTVPEPDTGETEWVVGTYSTGEQRILTSTHKVYEVVAVPDTTVKPDIGVDTDPPSWVEVGPTNKWALFDALNSTKTIDSTDIVTVLKPSGIISSVSGFGIENVSTVNVTVTDDVEGVVYDETVNMADSDPLVDFWEWFFFPITNKREFLLVDLPAYSDATITVTLTGSGDRAIGSLVIGNQLPMGVTEYGTSMQLLDFSIKERDEFGNFTVIPRRTSKLVDFDCYIETNKMGYLFRTLSDLTTIPTVWAALDGADSDPTLIYGYYKDSQLNLNQPDVSDITIQVEGLS